LDPKWKWVAMIDRLSGSDITKHDLVYDRNWIECLNLISYWHERDFVIEEHNKKLRKRNA
jgi:hypothetical protein